MQVAALVKVRISVTKDTRKETLRYRCRAIR